MINAILWVLFILIIVFTIMIFNTEKKESFVSGQCPTTMIKNGQKIMIYDPKMAKIPGVNPLVMDNLEDYKEYVKWQQKSKLNCPILYLEKVFDAQGMEQYEIRPSFDTDIPIGGINHSLPVVEDKYKEPKLLDASRDDPPYNQNSLPGFDPYNQMVGYGVGSDKMVLYPNKQNSPPEDYLRRK
jgi:hypothetical protein